MLYINKHLKHKTKNYAMVEHLFTHFKKNDDEMKWIINKHSLNESKDRIEYSADKIAQYQWGDYLFRTLLVLDFYGQPINPKYRISHNRVLRMDINLYAGEIQLAISRALANKTCSILTDDGTNNRSQFCPIILFTPQRIHIIALPHLERTTSKDILDAMIPFIRILIKKYSRCCLLYRYITVHM